MLCVHALTASKSTQHSHSVISVVTTFTFSNLGGHVPGLELLGAQGVADVLDGIAQTVGEVVGGIDAPGLARVRVRRVLDAVGHRVLLAVLHDVLHTQSSLGNGIWEWNIGMEYGEWNIGNGIWEWNVYNYI